MRKATETLKLSPKGHLNGRVQRTAEEAMARLDARSEINEGALTSTSEFSGGEWRKKADLRGTASKARGA